MQAIVAADNNWGNRLPEQTAGEHSIRYEVLFVRKQQEML